MMPEYRQGLIFKQSDMEKYMLPCLFKAFFGIPCPGCGGQRAALFLLEGRFADAFFMYPAIYPLVILAVLVGINYFRPFQQYSKLMSTFGILTVAAVLINYGFELSKVFGHG